MGQQALEVMSFLASSEGEGPREPPVQATEHKETPKRRLLEKPYDSHMWQALLQCLAPVGKGD